MKSRILKFILVASVATLFSCGDEDGSSELTVQSAGLAFLFPGTEPTKSTLDPCYPGQTMSEYHFKIKNVRTTWVPNDATRELTPLFLKIDIPETSFTGKYTCTISGVSAASLKYFLGYTTVNNDPGNIAAGLGTKSAVCMIECGAVQIKDTSRNFTVTGTLRLVGSTTVDGTDTPVTATTNITFQHIP